MKQSDSQVYGDAKTLEEFFEHLLLKWLPNFDFSKTNGDPDAEGLQEDLDLGSDGGEQAPPAKRPKRNILD